MTRREESEPALISVKVSFLLRLSEVKYHWSKSGKGDKTVNLLFHEKRLDPQGVGNLPRVQQSARSKKNSWMSVFITC